MLVFTLSLTSGSFDVGVWNATEQKRVDLRGKRVSVDVVVFARAIGRGSSMTTTGKSPLTYTLHRYVGRWNIVRASRLSFASVSFRGAYFASLLSCGKS